MMNLFRILLAIQITFLWQTTAFSAKILGLFAHPSESHFVVMRSVMSELARREHNVTVYSSHRLTEHIDRLQEIIIEPEYPFWRALQDESNARNGLTELSRLSEENLQKTLGKVGAAAVDYFLSHATIRKLLDTAVDAFDYDLVIVDLFYTEALLAFGHAYKKPIIGLVNSNFEDYMLRVQEHVVPIACSPIDFQSKDAKTKDNFWKRLSNTRTCMSRRKQFLKYNAAAQEKLIQKHFTKFKGTVDATIPSLYANVAVLLLNNHVPLLKPRPQIPNIIAAGGLHIRPPRELPWHIKRFLDESRSGVIYMNLGNEQLCSEIPQEKLKTLLNVFEKRTERVLWTCHDMDQVKNLPKNIMLQHIVSQTDILAHPHVKIFIMNGDLLSLQEGIVRHVPMIGIPIFRNEIANIEMGVKLNVAIQLDDANITESSLISALETLIHNTTFALKIREVSSAFRDRPLGALETCIYWIDYVLRHNGGAPIKTNGVGISSSQLHLFDLFIYYFVVGLLIVSVALGGCFVAFHILKKQHTTKMYDKLN